MKDELDKDALCLLWCTSMMNLRLERFRNWHQD